jgi:glycosyltransferase involved in cell wall biosynthesis
MSRLRVALLLPCLLTGGTEVATLETAVAMKSLGFAVAVIVYFDEVDAAMLQSFRGAGVAVHLLGVQRSAGWLGRLQLAGRLAWLVARRRFCLIWVQYMTPTLFPLVLSRLFTRKLIACVHVAASHYSANGLRRMNWLARHLCSRFVCVSGTVARGIFGEEGGILRASGRVVVIPNALDMAAVRAAVSRDWRAAAAWPADAVVIGYAGRLARNKGADVLLAAVAQLHARGLPVRLVVVGDGAEGLGLEAQALSLGIDGITRFVGRVPRGDVYGAIKGFDVAVVPSREEGFGLSALEAMAAGVPVVASRVDALKEVVLEGATGLLVTVDDPSALAVRLANLVSDAGLRRALGAAGAAHVSQLYDAPEFRARLAHLLARLGLPAGRVV